MSSSKDQNKNQDEGSNTSTKSVGSPSSKSVGGDLEDFSIDYTRKDLSHQHSARDHKWLQYLIQYVEGLSSKKRKQKVMKSFLPDYLERKGRSEHHDGFSYDNIVQILGDAYERGKKPEESLLEYLESTRQEPKGSLEYPAPTRGPLIRQGDDEVCKGDTSLTGRQLRILVLEKTIDANVGYEYNPTQAATMSRWEEELEQLRALESAKAQERDRPDGSEEGDTSQQSDTSDSRRGVDPRLGVGCHSPMNNSHNLNNQMSPLSGFATLNTSTTVVSQSAVKLITGEGKSAFTKNDYVTFLDSYSIMIEKADEKPGDPIFVKRLDRAAVRLMRNALIAAQFEVDYPAYGHPDGPGPMEFIQDTKPSVLLRWLINNCERKITFPSTAPKEKRYVLPCRTFLDDAKTLTDNRPVQKLTRELQTLSEQDTAGSKMDVFADPTWPQSSTEDTSLELLVVKEILTQFRSVPPHLNGHSLQSLTRDNHSVADAIRVGMWEKLQAWLAKGGAMGVPSFTPTDGVRGVKINTQVTFPLLLDAIFKAWTELRTQADASSVFNARQDDQRNAQRSGGGGSRSNDRSGGRASEKQSGDRKSHHNQTPATTTVGPKELCSGCGRTHGGGASECSWGKQPHPGFNGTGKSWAESENGKAYAARGHKTLQPLEMPHGGKVPADTVLGQYTKKDTHHKRGASGDARHGHKRNKGTPCDNSACNHEFAAIMANKSDDFVYLPLISQNKSIRLIKCLLDTGALQGNYVSEGVASWLAVHGNQQVTDNAIKLCSPLAGGLCINSSQILISSIGIFNDNTMHNDSDAYVQGYVPDSNLIKETIPFQFRVIKLPIGYDMILGRPAVRAHQLLPRLQPELCVTSRAEGHPVLQDTGDTDRHVVAVTAHQIEEGDEETLPELSAPLPWDTDTTDPDDVALFKEFDKRCYGSPSLKAKLTKLCREYKDIFGLTCRTEPSVLTPFKFEVDDSMWKSQITRGARPQSNTDNDEIKRQVEAMLKLGIIRPSMSPYASQVLMVPKPNSKAKRFCIDLRRLNSCTKSMLWPIPNIQEMLSRIVNQSPEIFGKIDLPAGYWQVAVDEACRHYTAFVTFMGTYEFTRIPMGHKNAGAYFQKEVGTDVLAGLLYVICELYIDDLLIYGKTEEEFLSRVRTVFERFREKKVIIHMEKFELGMSEVEFVGHVIDRSGTRFSAEKLQGVTDFPEPKNHGDIKSFVGLANYFRDHVRDLTGLLRPLQELVKSYTKRKDRNRPVEWTAERQESFAKAKVAIQNCQKLYYIQAGGELVLETDASEYGIAAFLYQVFKNPDGTSKIHPIRFISKSLDRTQCNWSTPEKECYAIFYTLVKLEHLLRDVHFKVRTDHKNLLRAYTSGSKKVLRWRMQMQSFDIDYEHVKGEDNIVADTLSRLCPSNDTSLQERAQEFTAKEAMSSAEEMLFALEPLVGEIKADLLCGTAIHVITDIHRITHNLCTHVCTHVVYTNFNLNRRFYRHILSFI